MAHLGSLVASMFKIGCIGFGGGNALIPVLEKEFVDEKKLLTAKEYNNYVVMANITPGALPVEMATAIGRHVSGYAGMLLAPIAMAFPGIFATVILVSILSQFSGSLLSQVEYISIGIGAFIVYLLIDYNRKMLVQFKLTSMKIKRICVVGLVFLLTCGKEIRNITGIGGTPILDISTVNILYLAIFFIFYSFVEFSGIRAVVGGLISGIYVMGTGKAELLRQFFDWCGFDGAQIMVYFMPGLRILMAVLAVYASVINVRKLGKTKKIPVKKLAKEELVWITFFVVVSLPAIFSLGTKALHYMIQGLESTVVSFGGGEAYLTVAEGMFISEDTMTAKQLYGQLLPVVNALPGSILCKMLSGIGYYIGLNTTGSMAVGYFTAIAGLAASITASCGVVICLIYFYEKFEELEMFVMLKKCIRPIVGGLLLSTAAALLCSCMDIAALSGWGTAPFLLMMLGFVVLAFIIKKFTKLPDILCIVIYGVITLGVFNFVKF